MLLLFFLYFLTCLSSIKGNIIRVDEYGYPVTYQARGLIENQKYEFWVSASTSMGEGEPTAVVTQTATTRGVCLYF